MSKKTISTKIYCLVYYGTSSPVFCDDATETAITVNENRYKQITENGVWV